jgi:ABC-2 type transport system permease protein
VFYLLSPAGAGPADLDRLLDPAAGFFHKFFRAQSLFHFIGVQLPISSMPEVLQWSTYLNPLRYYLIIICGTFLKGIGVDILGRDLLALAGIAVVLLTVSILQFRKFLE